jgi:MFS family permease
MWKRTLAGMSVQAWQQMSGANVMTYYVVYVFQMAGLTGNINLISSGVQYALFIIFTTVVFFFIDKTGRRPLLIYGAVAMGICQFVVGGVLGTYGEYVPGGVDGNLNVLIRVTGSPSNVVIAFSYLLIIVYALTLAPVAWVYAAEVWSLETRATGMALAAVANWLFNFALGASTPHHLSKLPQLTSLSRPLRPPRLRQHHVQNVPHLRRALLRRRDPGLLHVPRDVRQDARGDRDFVQCRGPEAVEYEAWWE